MLCDDAQEFAGKPHSRRGDRVGQCWGRTKGKIGFHGGRRLRQPAIADVAQRMNAAAAPLGEAMAGDARLWPVRGPLIHEAAHNYLIIFLNQTAESRAQRLYPIGPPYVYAMDVPVGRRAA